MRGMVVLLLGALFLPAPLPGTSPAQEPATASAEAPRSAQPVSTYSIVARDPRTGRLGVAVQSHWFSVGSIVTWAEAGVGAVATQAFAREAYGPEILADLREGKTAEEALAGRIADDPGSAVRQVAVVDAQGRVAVHTGEACVDHASHGLGQGFSCQANIMANDEVVPAMVQGYVDAEGDLADRLVAALEAAERAGGDLRGRQSAAILIVEGRRRDEPWQGVLVDLRVEDHPRPLTELRRLLRVQRAYQAANEGDVHLEQGDMEKALDAYARAEELYPEQVELTYWRAIALLGRGHEEPAFEMLRQVFAEEPVWVEMTPRLVRAGHFEADDALLARIAELAPRNDLRAMLARSRPERIEGDVRKLVSFGTRHTLSDTESDTRGIGAARRWLQDEFQHISDEFHGGRLQVELVAHEVPSGSRRLPDGAQVVNVVATLPGSDPDRLVVVSGHYDSRNGDGMDAAGDAPGANDDASGTAAVLEAARLLGGLEPRATVIFMAVAGEEQGLYGAAGQAQQWKDAGKEVAAMFTMDIVGGVRGSSGKQEPWRLRVFSEGVPSKGRPTFGSDNDAPSRQLARYLKRAASELVPGFELTLVFRQDRYLRGGDHKPFFELGWPAVRLTEPHENYDWQHQDVRTVGDVRYGDLPENVDYDYVSRVARSVSAAIGELALAPPAPESVQVDTTELTPHTRLLWEPCPEPVAGYAVLYRPTHEPFWTDVREVGKTTQVRLQGLSKDDYLFAVQSIGPGGHRSLPVYPTPKFR